MLDTPVRLSIRRILVTTWMLVLLLIAKDFALVPTYRLFLDGRPGASAVQQFDIEGTRVVPLIVTHGADRVLLPTDVGQHSTVRVGLRTSTPTSYAIEWQHQGTRRVLAQGTADGSRSIVAAYPTGTGTIELVSGGPLAWVDPRVTRDLPLWPYAWALGLSALWLLARPRRQAATGPETRLTWFKAAAATISLASAVLLSEAALRALGERTPNGITTERHDLGEVTRDPHWVDSPRYGRRLRANVHTLNEWRDGDIVRMGYLPPAAGPLQRFSFQTDAEGFRNTEVRRNFAIAALGDSLTDAMTMAGDASWPAQLEQRLGVAVQNYGTAGFGPQQELLVLKDVVAPHRPRTVVLAFYSGNDIFDAEAFEAFQQSGGTARRPAQGWRPKRIVIRADQWFVTSALRVGSRWFGSPNNAVATPAPPAPTVTPVTGSVTTVASFDHGRFTVPVNGRPLQWAFMPPYLNTLHFSAADLSARRGWRLTRDAISEMQSVSRSFGAAFVVMFVPFKSQVYLPLLPGAFSKDEIRAALSFSLRAFAREADVDRLFANRLAQNDLMARFCAEAGIPFLDTTAALAARAANGVNVYFPDESHLNEAGEALIAEALARFLTTLGDQPERQ